MAVAAATVTVPVLAFGGLSATNAGVFPAPADGAATSDTRSGPGAEAGEQPFPVHEREPATASPT